MIFKKICLYVMLFLGLALVTSCEENKTSFLEEDHPEIVRLHNGIYDPIVFSSAGLSIAITLDDTTSEIYTNAGSFNGQKEVQQMTLKSEELAYWTPLYFKNGERIFVDNGYLNIIIKRSDRIIGYAIVENKKSDSAIYQDGNIYYSNLIKCSLFPEALSNGKIISENYVNNCMRIDR